MATKHTDQCLIKAADDEPIFVLRAKDKHAPEVVRFWAFLAAQTGCPPDKVQEAIDLTKKMEAWPTRKYPD